MFLVTPILILSILGSALGFQCSEGGRLYSVGQSWVGQGGCKVCRCTDPTDWGLHCTDIPCGSKGKAGSLLCHYYYVFYTAGEAWTAADNCNICTCLKTGAMNCTNQPCKNTGFDNPKETGGEFMDCPYKTLWYHYEDHFMADDGCNTCACVMPGNYATFPVCTTMPCSQIVG